MKQEKDARIIRIFFLRSENLRKTSKKPQSLSLQLCIVQLIFSNLKTFSLQCEAGDAIRFKILFVFEFLF